MAIDRKTAEGIIKLGAAARFKERGIPADTADYVLNRYVQRQQKAAARVRA